EVRLDQFGALRVVLGDQHAGRPGGRRGGRHWQHSQGGDGPARPSGRPVWYSMVSVTTGTTGGARMATETAEETGLYLCLELAGTLMTPEEFDAVEDYDENYRYELINGVLIVAPIASGEETGPNEELGRWLRNYREQHPQGSVL